MSEQTFSIGQQVAFTTPGRFPRDHTGTVESISSAFLEVKCDADGKVRKTRPGATRAA